MSNSIVPAGNDQFRNWVTSHAERWAEVHGEVGLSAALAAQFSAEAVEMEETWDALAQAEVAAEVARNNWKRVKEKVRRTANADVARIKTFAATSESNAAAMVYTKSDIPAPRSPVFNVPPGRCESVKARLDTVTGSVTLTWRCRNPATTNGTVYTVQRRVGTEGEWTPLGVTSVQMFTDNAVPATATGIVQYNLTAMRSGLVGDPSGPVTVVLGHVGGAVQEPLAIAVQTPSRAA